MIASISGLLKNKLDSSIVVEVNGIGYHLHVSNLTISKLNEIGSEISLFTELQIKDDKILMYGFLKQSELNMFRLLQSVQGIGPKASLSILSAVTIEEIILGISSSDKNIFKKAEGIGLKVATRIVSELQDKITSFGFNNQNYNKFENEVKNNNFSDVEDKKIIENSISAIVNLGYSRSDAFKAVLEAKQELIENEKINKINLQNIIPLALKRLSG